MKAVFNLFAIVAISAISISHAWAGPTGQRRSDAAVACEVNSKVAVLRMGVSLSPALSAEIEKACAAKYPAQ
jgi:hypothetical protein